MSVSLLTGPDVETDCQVRFNAVFCKMRICICVFVCMHPALSALLLIGPDAETDCQVRFNDGDGDGEGDGEELDSVSVVADRAGCRDRLSGEI